MNETNEYIRKAQQEANFARIKKIEELAKTEVKVNNENSFESVKFETKKKNDIVDVKEKEFTNEEDSSNSKSNFFIKAVVGLIILGIILILDDLFGEEGSGMLLLATLFYGFVFFMYYIVRQPVEEREELAKIVLPKIEEDPNEKLNLYEQIKKLKVSNKDSNFENKVFSSKYLSDDDSIRKLIKPAELNENNSLIEPAPSLGCAITLVVYLLLLSFPIYYIVMELHVLYALFILFIFVPAPIIQEGIDSLKKRNKYKKEKENFIFDGFYFFQDYFIISKYKYKINIPKNEIKNIFILINKYGDEKKIEFTDKMFIHTVEGILIYLKQSKMEKLVNLFNINSYEYTSIDFDDLELYLMGENNAK